MPNTMVRLRARVGVLALLSVVAAACGSSGGSNDGSADGSSAGEKGGGGAGGTGGHAGAGASNGGSGGASNGGSGGTIGGAGAGGSAGTGGAAGTGTGGGTGTGKGGTTGGGGTVLAGTGGSAGGAGLSGSGGATGTAGATGGSGAGGTGTGGSAGGAGLSGSGGATGTAGAVGTGTGGASGGATGTAGASGTGTGGTGTAGASGGATGTAGASGTGAGGTTTGGTGTGGTGTAGASGGATGTAGSCGAASTLVDSSDTLIDLFVVESGIIVVDASSVSLIGRDGKVIKAVPFARQITAAVFDGTTLVIADEAELTVMSSALAVGPTAFLTVSCASAVLVGENHFVCGPANDWQRSFYTYDVGMNPPALLASGGEYTYNGIPMRRVPGTDEFVTVTLDSDPPSFYLFQVAADTGAVTFEGGSPFDTYDANLVFAFDGSPATHMIQDQGDILALTGTGCQNGIDSLDGACFVQTGTLGTLRTGQGLIGLGDDGAGRLVGVVSPSSNTYPFNSACASGCPSSSSTLPVGPSSSSRAIRSPTCPPSCVRPMTLIAATRSSATRSKTPPTI